MSLSRQENTIDDTKLIGNTLGNAASWSSSSDIRRERNPVKEDNENDRTKYSSGNEFLRNYPVLQKKHNPKTQPEVISWVGKFLDHCHDTLATVLFVSRNAISWLEVRSCLLRFVQLPVATLEKSTMTLATSYLYKSYQKLSAEKWLVVTYIRTRHTEPKCVDYSRNTWGHFKFKFLSLRFQNLLEKKV